jgi:hypothetical protein
MRTEFLLESLKGTVKLEDVDIDGRITLICILRKQGGEVWTGMVLLRIGTGGGFCEHGNESFGSIKGEEFLD